MLKYSQVAKNPKLFRSVTGLYLKEFNCLYSEIEERYGAAESKRLAKTDRRRKIGAGRRFQLDLKDRVMMTLMYHRMHTSHDILGLLFNLDNSNVYRNITYLEPMIKSHISIPARKYPNAGKSITIKGLLANFPEFRAATNSVRQSIFGVRNPDKKKMARFSKYA